MSELITPEPTIGDFVEIFGRGAGNKKFRNSFVWSGVILDIRPTKSMANLEFEVYAHGFSRWLSALSYGFETMSAANLNK